MKNNIMLFAIGLFMGYSIAITLTAFAHELEAESATEYHTNNSNYDYICMQDNDCKIEENQDINSK